MVVDAIFSRCGPPNLKKCSFTKADPWTNENQTCLWALMSLPPRSSLLFWALVEKEMDRITSPQQIE
jgi:hypothetical protein